MLRDSLKLLVTRDCFPKTILQNNLESILKKKKIVIENFLFF